MIEKKSETYHLSLKDLISESLIRDIILFIFLFLLILAQGWNNILILLFPLISFTFSIFFRIIWVNKPRTELINSSIKYNPLGLEKKHANRLFFCTLFQLILLYWLGGESLTNPHLINNYFTFFQIIFVFFYTFGFFWIYLDLWKNTRIEIKINKSENKKQEYSSQVSDEKLYEILASLNLKSLRLSSYITLIIFLFVNILNIFSIFFINDVNLGIQLNLPGTQILIFSCLFYGFLLISPLITIFLLFKNYKCINDIDREKLDSIIEELPYNKQAIILEGLKEMNKKIKEQLKIE
ncbi:MAG: hypothetical protein ACFE9Z_05335 [Promethearchaeota archaeon]